MNDLLKVSYSSALEDFLAAQRKGALTSLLGRLSGRSVGLLSYEDVRQKLKAHVASERGLKDIPIDHIVGSVSRYTDFTRDFLPTQSTDQHRWAMVKAAVTDMAGVEPISVYQLGEAYFVIDGHHRISVARDLGARSIQAYVTEVKARVPLTPDVQPEDLIIKSEYVNFLERTHLDQTRPGSRLEVTAAGQYQALEEHIAVHRYFMGQQRKRYVPFEEAAVHWYDQVYLPVVEAIRQQGILRDFPDRTETDLYLWLGDHRAALEKELGWEIKPAAAVENLASRHGARLSRLAKRIGKGLLPAELEPGAPPGEWRRSKSAEQKLFSDLLVPVSGQAKGWAAVEQALAIAAREGARVHGLHVFPRPEQPDSPAAGQLKSEFEACLERAGLRGELTLAVGPVARQVCFRANWVDLIVVNLAHPPGGKPLARLSSGFSKLIRSCSRPILAVPGATSPLASALLAYDGSPKSQEALYLATYLSSRWQTRLTVMTVFDSERLAPETLQKARLYLEDHQVEATYESSAGAVAPRLLLAAEAHNCDLIIMGGYGDNPLLEVMLGSTVDQVLRSARRPVLICR